MKQVGKPHIATLGEYGSQRRCILRANAFQKVEHRETKL
jgi:hypothetical protein